LIELPNQAPTPMTLLPSAAEIDQFFKPLSKTSVICLTDVDDPGTRDPIRLKRRNWDGRIPPKRSSRVALKVDGLTGGGPIYDVDAPGCAGDLAQRAGTGS